jgi:hypothetical protein
MHLESVDRELTRQTPNLLRIQLVNAFTVNAVKFSERANALSCRH